MQSEFFNGLKNANGIKEKFCVVVGMLEKLCLSNVFPFIVAGFAFVFHVLALDLFGILLFGFISSLFLLFFKDGRPGFTVGITTVFIVSTKNGPGYGSGENYYATPQIYIPIICIAVILLASLVFRAVKNRAELKSAKQIIPLSVFSIGLLLSGIGQEYYGESFPFGLIVGFFYVGIYVILTGCLNRCENFLEYVSALFCALALLIVAQVAVIYIDRMSKSAIFDGDWKNYIMLGWGINNNAGAMLVFCLPLIMYRVEKGGKGSIFYHISAFVTVIGTVMTLSKASILFAVPLFIALWIRAFIKNPNRKSVAITAGVIVAFGVAALIFILNKFDFSKVLGYFYNALLGVFDANHETSRNKLIQQMIEFFKQSPIFGAGFAKAYHNPIAVIHTSMFHTLAHNFIFQTLGSGGIVGMATLAYFVTAMVKLFKKKYEGKFQIVCFLIGFIGVSLFDITYFIPYCLVMFMLMVIHVERDAEKENK